MFQDLNIQRREITFGLDSVIVRKFTNGVEGGVTLDVSNYYQSNVIAGQVVITDGNVIRPMPVNGDNYGTLPEGFKYYGVVYRTSRVRMGVSIMTRGCINKFRAPYNLETIYQDFHKDCPYIILSSDADEMAAYERLEATDGYIMTSDGEEIWFRTEGRGENLEGV